MAAINITLLRRILTEKGYPDCVCIYLENAMLIRMKREMAREVFRGTGVRTSQVKGRRQWTRLTMGTLNLDEQ